MRFGRRKQSLDSHDDAFVHLVSCFMGSSSLVLRQERDSAWGEVGRVLLTFKGKIKSARNSKLIPKNLRRE